MFVSYLHVISRKDEFGRGFRQKNRQLCCELEELQQLQNLYEGEHGIRRSQDSYVEKKSLA